MRYINLRFTYLLTLLTTTTTTTCTCCIANTNLFGVSIQTVRICWLCLQQYREFGKRLRPFCTFSME